MNATSPSTPADSIDLQNPDGDVAICGVLPGPAPASALLENERVCFFAPLDGRTDLERILRRLHRHRSVRHVILCGDDHGVSGDALISVLRDGVDIEGRLSGGRGFLSGGLTAETLDAVSADVEIWDLREKPQRELSHALRGLEAPATSRQTEPLPEPGIPDRKIFLSRKTSFPVFGADVGDCWLQLLNLALKVGAEKRASNGERFAEALNTLVTIGLPVIAEDLEVDEVPRAQEHADYLDFSGDDFERYYRRLSSSSASGEPTPSGRWGGRLHAIAGEAQIEKIYEQLRESGDEHAATLSCIEPNRGGRAPGLLSGTFEVTEGKLYGSFVFRCVDLYSDWPLEAMALLRLHRQIARRLDVEAGAATFVIHSARLSDHDWERASRLLAERFKRPLPLQVDHSGVFLFGNDGGKARGMLLDHDAGTIFWEEEFESAQELSWYIVDSMPWLLPQHIRYVGQECSSLTRAIEERVCYLQG